MISQNVPVPRPQAEEVSVSCHMCGIDFLADSRDDTFLCPKCVRRVPSFVRKALGDVWPCRIGLRNGQVLEFHTCRIDGEFLYVEIDNDCFEPHPHSFAVKLDIDTNRGLDIRIDEIAWASEASS